jgi:mRNA interferase MazF
MAFEQYDVVTALFPFTDAPVRKTRPVVVLSTGTFNAAHGHIIGAMITTAAHSRWPSDHVILDPAASGLKRPSVVRWKVFTLPFTVIGGCIGAMAEPDRRMLSEAFATIAPSASGFGKD